jgi:chromosome segregation ATPase
MPTDIHSTALQRVCDRQRDTRTKLEALESSLGSAKASAADHDAEVGRMKAELGRREREVEEAGEQLRLAQEALAHAQLRESNARETLRTASSKARLEHAQCRRIEKALEELCEHVLVSDEILQVRSWVKPSVKNRERV